MPVSLTLNQILERIKDYEPLKNEGICESVLIASIIWHDDTLKIEVENCIRALLRGGKIYESTPKHYKIV